MQYNTRRGNEKKIRQGRTQDKGRARPGRLTSSGKSFGCGDVNRTLTSGTAAATCPITQQQKPEDTAVTAVRSHKLMADACYVQ